MPLKRRSAQASCSRASWSMWLVQLLLLAAGELGVAPRHVVGDAEDASQLARLASEVECEVCQPVGLSVGFLRAHNREIAACDASCIRHDEPAGDLRKRGFAAAVVAEQTGPAARERDGYVVQNGVGCGGVGVAYAGQGYLHGASLLGHGRSRQCAHQATCAAARRRASDTKAEMSSRCARSLVPPRRSDGVATRAAKPFCSARPTRVVCAACARESTLCVRAVASCGEPVFGCLACGKARPQRAKRLGIRRAARRRPLMRLLAWKCGRLAFSLIKCHVKTF